MTTLHEASSICISSHHLRENSMHISTKLRTAAIAATAVAALGLSTAAKADSGSVRFSVVKAGFVIGGSGGSGVLTFHGRRYPISIGGLSYGFTFGASQTEFRGRVTNIRRPSDIAGIYAAAGAGAALGVGAQGIVLTNQKGAVLELAGRQVGAIVSADLNGLALSLR
jgi:lipid-binding SYLF domain-containing protein